MRCTAVNVILLLKWLTFSSSFDLERWCCFRGRTLENSIEMMENSEMFGANREHVIHAEAHTLPRARMRGEEFYKPAHDTINDVSQRWSGVDSTATALVSPPFDLSVHPFCDHIPVTSTFSLSLCSEASPVTTDQSTLCLKATARERQGLCSSGCVRWREGGMEGDSESIGLYSRRKKQPQQGMMQHWRQDRQVDRIEQWGIW